MASVRIEEDLMLLRRRIEAAKAEKAKAEGAFQQLLKQLETDFGVKDLKAGKELLEELGKQIQVIEDQLSKGMEAIRSKYGEALE
jgi:hypothetical protein